MNNKQIGCLLIAIFILSSCAGSGSNQSLRTKSNQAHLDNEELASMEIEIQELKNRILILEARLSSIKDSEEPVIPNEGWKVLTSWRKLKTGMDYESVERILGPAHRIDGGIIANWYYKNGGRVNFFEGSVQRWEEPE